MDDRNYYQLIRPLPSTFPVYLSFPSFSIIRPVRSQRLDSFPAPCWFCIKTFYPGFRSGNTFVCSAHLSLPTATLCLKGNPNLRRFKQAWIHR